MWLQSWYTRDMKPILIGTLILGACYGMGISAEAHQVKTDNGVTVLFHVDPSDEPYSGTTTRMYLAFSSKTGQFDADACDCIISIVPYDLLPDISSKGTRIDVTTHPEKMMGGYSFSYIFPRHDVYAVMLEGAPREGASFTPFRIVYDLRVARGEEISVELSPAVGLVPELSRSRILLTGAAILFGLVAILVGKRFYKK